MADERIPFRNAPWSSYMGLVPAKDRASSFVRSQLYGGEDQLPQQDDAAGALMRDRLALMGAGMAPGSGAAAAAGLFPRAEGGYEPSMMQDFRDKNIVSGLMKGASAAGDALYATGAGAWLGGMLKAPLAAKLAAMGMPMLAKGEKVAGLAGGFAPATAPVRGQTTQEIARMQKTGLSDKAGNIIADLRAADPTFNQTAKFLLPNELEIIARNPGMIEPMKRLLDVIPSAAQFASLSKAGAPKLGWYRGSTQALLDVFGKEDAPRFAALLAATSPQTSVESNLTNALNIWREWNSAGRPTDPTVIKAVMGRSVQGNKGEDSVLGAWVPNTVRALSSQDPLKTVLSGPKVDSFFRNLADDVYKVTNDAWMANVSGVDQGLFRQSPTAKQLAEGNAGFSPGYLAMSARQREAGQKIGLTPAEVQETGWSVAMPLMELQNNTGIPARDLLQRGMLTRDMIAGTPDFETLFTQPQYADILQRSGYGDKLQNLTPTVGMFGANNPIPMTAADERNLMASAKTLEDLRAIRGRESASKKFYPGAEFNSIMGYQPVEAIGGNGVGDFQELLEATPGSRDAFSSSALATFKDEQGHDIINRRLGLKTIATQPVQGAFQPLPGPDGIAKPLETNVAGATGFELPIGKSGQVADRTQNILDYSAARRGMFLGQYGVPNIAEVPIEGGPNLAIKRDGKLDAPTLRAHLEEYPNTAAIDTGRGAYVLNFDEKTPFTTSDEEKIATTFSGNPDNYERTKSGMTKGRGYVDFEAKPESPIAPRSDLPMFAAENAGHGLVSSELVRRFNAMPAKEQKIADTDPAVLQQAKDILAFRQGKIANGGNGRLDINNSIELLSRPGGHGMMQQGLDALQSGGKSALEKFLIGAGVAAPSAGLAATREDQRR
jgi:hypothetical protein